MYMCMYVYVCVYVNRYIHILIYMQSPFTFNNPSCTYIYICMYVSHKDWLNHPRHVFNREAIGHKFKSGQVPWGYQPLLWLAVEPPSIWIPQDFLGIYAANSYSFSLLLQSFSTLTAYIR